MYLITHLSEQPGLLSSQMVRKGTIVTMIFMALLSGVGLAEVPVADPEKTVAGDGDHHVSATGDTVPAPTQALPHFYIQQYHVDGGGKLLSRDEIETAVYPFLGPYRTPQDIEQARAALEQAYQDKGYKLVTVETTGQVRGHVATLQVMQNPVGRLRVHGAQYFSIDEIKREAPSMQEGQVPNFNDVSKDNRTLNQLPDRQVTIVPLPGKVPGTVDIDLNVKDTPPLHGSLELNNRYSADTTPLRLNGSVDYDNLWQLGHSIGFSFQIAPENLDDTQVFSGYYSAHVPGLDWLTLMLQGTDQDSDVNTLGGIGVAGKGQIIGGRAIISLPDAGKGFYHSLSLGVDYKHFEQDTNIAGDDTGTPLTYIPFSAAYSATWSGKGYETSLNPSVVFGPRDLGSSGDEFELNRHGSDGGFFYFRTDVSHTRDLPEGFQAFAKVQGQATDKPLVNSEQFSGGGLGTVRGYLESEELGDNALFGSLELRTPSLAGLLGKTVDDWRFYLFGEGGVLSNNQELAEQKNTYTLTSIGAGTRFKLEDHYNGSLDLGVPLNDATNTQAYHLMLTFRVWAEF